MGLLGMMAAGAAGGLRNTHNQNVAAQNQLEIEQARHGMQMDQEALREKYLNRRSMIEREQKLEDFRLTNERADKVYDVKRAHEVADLESGRAHDLARDSIREGGATGRTHLQLKAEELQHRERMEAGLPKRGGSTKGSGSSTLTTLDKQAESFLRKGIAKDEPEAYRMAARPDVEKLVYKDEMLSDEEKAAKVDAILHQRFPSPAPTGPVTAPQAPVVEKVRNFNHKTGKFE